MKTSKKNQLIQDQALERFIKFLKDRHNEVFKVLQKDVPIKQGYKTNFDYLIASDKRKIAIEITRLLEPEDQFIESVQWRNIISSLRSELKKIIENNKAGWTGLWLVTTPKSFKATKTKAPKLILKILPALVNGMEKGKRSIKINDWIFKLKKFGNGAPNVVFSSNIKGGFIDPSLDIGDRINRFLPKKVKQLDTKLGERILLIINEYAHGRVDEFVKALQRLEDLWNWKYIDYIYYESSPNTFHLVYSKEFRKGYLTKKVFHYQKYLEPFNLWLPFLIDKNGLHFFETIKDDLDKKRILEVVPEPHEREQIVELGTKLIEQNKIKLALEIIDTFITDPDPSLFIPTSEKNSVFDYHRKILEGDDPGIITTVRGHLAWTIQRLALKKQYTSKAFKYNKKLLKTKNLYIVQRAIIPLVEIVARRQWLSKKEQIELKKILFKLLEKYGQYPAIAHYLTDAFYYLKDVSTSEAEKIVTRLNDKKNLAVLTVYFAIYRKNHFLKLKKFNPKPLEKILINNIMSGDPEFRKQIAFQFRKIISDDLKQFQNLKPYLEILISSYQPSIYADEIIDVIKNIMEKQPQLAIKWFEKILANLARYAHKDKKTSPEPVGFFDIEKIFKTIAEKEPEKLIRNVTLIKGLWMLGAQIFGLKGIFESYQYIRDKKIRQEAIKNLKKIYQNMKKENPKLISVDWGL